MRDMHVIRVVHTYYIFIYLFITPGAGTYIQYMYVATYCIHDILCIHTCAHVHHVCVHSIYAHNIIMQLCMWYMFRDGSSLLYS